MHIEPFKVEIWMNAWETRCDLNLAETCVDSLTVEELLRISGQNDASLSALLPLKMTYGEIIGSDRLRDAVAGLFFDQTRDAVTITHGAIAANALVHKALVSRGDQVIAVVPSYQQHYSIPESIGAEVRLHQLHETNAFLPDLDLLRQQITPSTRLIALTNPNNPTGALIQRPMLEEIAGIARDVGAYILCDEVYRGTDQVGDGMSASIVDVYEKGISTGSMSKAYSLAGLRLGWIVAPPEVTEAVHIHRDYDTISVGAISDHLATLALENRSAILARSHAIPRSNLARLSDWVDSQPLIHWIKPQSGTTALLRIDVPMTSRAFCVALLEETGVMFTPGDAFDMEGYVRIGFGNQPDVFEEGLARVATFLARQ